jgi:rhodanese-related sulfurtransferase
MKPLPTHQSGSQQSLVSKLSVAPGSWTSGARFFCFLVVGLLSGCSAGLSSPDWESLKREIRDEFPTASTITVSDLAEWRSEQQRRQPLLLDARSEEEFRVSHLLGAQSVPTRGEALRVLESIEADRPIVVYCSVGYRSAALVEAIQNIGNREVYNLEGSIFEWANQGHPVFRERLQVSEVHPYDEKWGRLLNRDLWSWGDGRK